MNPARAAGTDPGVNLTNCDREPIHVPGRIQPHGVLIALREPGLQITAHSDNLAACLGIERRDWIGADLAELLGSGHFLLARLRSAPDPDTLARLNPSRLTLGTRAFDAIVHRTGDRLVLELEPEFGPAEAEPGAPEESVSFLSVHHEIGAALRALEAAPDLGSLCEATAREVRVLSGFDRVMVYRFDEEWNGKVIAEARAPELPTWLGLQYPSTDIPRQARELYLRNWIRIIPDVAHEPSVIRSAPGEPALDLSFSVLRSVSPMHVEYLRNMEVGASMSVSLIREGRLWGLIACHHRVARPLPYALRLGCEFVGKFMSLQITAKEKGEDREYRAALEALQPVFAARMRGIRDRRADLAGRAAAAAGAATYDDEFLSPLLDEAPDLRELAGAHGAAILYRGRCRSLGRTPGEAAIRRLASALTIRGKPEVFATDRLAEAFPELREEAERFRSEASGLLAMGIPEPGDQYVFWFRPEVIQTVNWAGDPRKAVHPVPVDGVPRLHPRKSFELWRERVALRSLPWRPVEIAAVAELRRNVIDVDLERQLDREVEARAAAERSNSELDEYAHIVSHDLKEPLRGIRAYSEFVLEDERGRLDEGSAKHLDDIRNMARRAEALLANLYQHSRLGREELARGPVNLDEVLEDVRVLLSARLRETGAELRVPRPLPTVRGDRVRLQELFSNLVGNAIKYNDSERKWVEVGYTDGASPTEFYVRDNGIGIPPESLEAIFGLFRRLHPPDRYGGGTGSGLAIARRIVERHGGRIRAESEPGRGSVFRFTLG